MGSVAVAPYTEENPAAHGGTCHVEQCEQCSARRVVNRNGSHVEFGPWDPMENLQLRVKQLRAAWKREQVDRPNDFSVHHMKYGEFRIKVLDDGIIETYGSRFVSESDIGCMLQGLFPCAFNAAKRIREAYLEYEDAANELSSRVKESRVSDVG